MDTAFYFTEFQTALSDIQQKARTLAEESSAALDEAKEFARGNVEAATEAGKILSEGLRDLGSNTVAQSRTAFETFVADVNGLAGARTPSEFLQVQSVLGRHLLSAAIDGATKNSAAILNLTSSVVVPLSSRASLCIEKICSRGGVAGQ